MQKAIWAVLALVYGVFYIWFNPLSGPLTEEEVAHYLSAMEGRDGEIERLETLRTFLEGDDGEPFYMLNLITLNETPKPMDGVEPGQTSQQILNKYTADHMLPEMLKRGSMPLMFGDRNGPTVELWGVERDRNWQSVGLVRYRSRRDMMEIVTGPGFGDAHIFKAAAMEKTVAFPTNTNVLNPNVVVPMLLLIIGLFFTNLTRRKQSSGG